MGDNKAFEVEIQAWNTAQLASKQEIQMNEAGKVTEDIDLLFFILSPNNPTTNRSIF